MARRRKRLWPRPGNRPRARRKQASFADILVPFLALWLMLSPIWWPLWRLWLLLRRYFRRPAVNGRIERSPDWPKLRSRFIRLCERHIGLDLCCMKCSHPFPPGHRQGLQVDHIVSVNEDTDREMDITNLQLLCKSCNAWKRHRRGRPDYRPAAIKSAALREAGLLTRLAERRRAPEGRSRIDVIKDPEFWASI